ncbi:MAG: histidinol-phosphate transaminase [Actinomycetota bacterium]
MSTSPAPRPGLREVGPYDPPQLEVTVRLNANESPLPLPSGFSDDLADAVRELPLHRYPDGQMRALRGALAGRTGHAADGIWAANGSNEVLTQLLQAYGGPGRRAVVFEPTYVLHRRLCWLTQTEVVERRLEPPFRIGEPDLAWAAGEEPDVVFVCLPNNPTGNAQALESVAALAGSTGALVIVDEAYVDFGGASALPLTTDHPNIAVVRTFSKAFALAGARIGYVLASAEIVEDLQRVRLPYHLSALTQAAGLTALRHSDEAAASIAAIRAERDRIVAALARIDGATVFPSDANFVLFQPPGDAAALWRGLLDRGVLIRDLTTVVPNALRVTAGTTHEVDLFLKAMDEVLR